MKFLAYFSVVTPVITSGRRHTHKWDLYWLIDQLSSFTVVLSQTTYQMDLTLTRQYQFQLSYADTCSTANVPRKFLRMSAIFMTAEKRRMCCGFGCADYFWHWNRKWFVRCVIKLLAHIIWNTEKFLRASLHFGYCHQKQEIKLFH